MKPTRESFAQAISELGKVNKNLVALTADVADSTKIQIFGDEFPDRLYNLGIAEQNLISTAAGLAMCNKIPLCFAYAVFVAGRAYEQIRNAVCYSKVNVKVIGTHAGITAGEDGATHQMLEDINLMRGLSNMKVLAPCDEVSCRWAAKQCISIDGPMYVRLARQKVEEIYNQDEKFELGKGKVHGDGTDIGIITYGTTMQESLKAKKILEEKGYSVRVIDMLTIKPVDEDLIVKTAKEVKDLFTVEDHNVLGGIGSIVADVLCAKYPRTIIKLGINDTFGQSGKYTDLLKYYKIDGEGIANSIMENLCK